jgi:hypothetical protein
MAVNWYVRNDEITRSVILLTDRKCYYCNKVFSVSHLTERNYVELIDEYVCNHHIQILVETLRNPDFVNNLENILKIHTLPSPAKEE